MYEIYLRDWTRGRSLSDADAILSLVTPASRTLCQPMTTSVGLVVNPRGASLATTATTTTIGMQAPSSQTPPVVKGDRKASLIVKRPMPAAWMKLRSSLQARCTDCARLFDRLFASCGSLFRAKEIRILMIGVTACVTRITLPPDSRVNLLTRHRSCYSSMQRERRRSSTS